MRHNAYTAHYLVLDIPKVQVKVLSEQLKEFEAFITRTINFKQGIVSLDIHFPDIYKCDGFLDKYGAQYIKEHNHEINR